jgi:hypothetical protein
MSAQALWNLQSLTLVAQSGVAQSSYAFNTAVSATGDVYVAGGPGVFAWLTQPTHSIGDTGSEQLLVAKLDPSGMPVYQTAIGGAEGASLTLDSKGNLYVYGVAKANAFTTTPAASNSSASVSPVISFAS